MTDEKTFTLPETHRYFAAALNNETWDLIEKTDRNASETERMIHGAHASALHWIESGTGINHARAEYLCSRAYAAAGYADSALRHALRCKELTTEHADEATDWDRTFALEVAARAHAIAGNMDTARQLRREAEAACRAIADAEDREVVERELAREPWGGI